MVLSTLRDRLWCLASCAGLYENPTFSAYLRLVDALVEEGDTPRQVAGSYARFYHLLKEERYIGLGSFLWDWLRFTDTPYGRLVEMGGEDASLTAAAEGDVATLRDAAVFDLTPLLPQALPRPALDWTASWDFDALTQFYQKEGCGQFAQYRAFRWEKGTLVPIPQPDAPEAWELWGYDDQRRQVRENALALVEGRPVNHVLLYGDSGTGKSATVKSLLAQPGLERLRLIEMDKDHLEDIPALVRRLDGRAQAFILFIDDLAFDADDKTYSQLKTILEGSLERQRPNVAVYATSNRRNLVRQNFSDRSGDDMDISETIAEKTSLAERFGVRVCYQSLSPKEFLRMVADLAQLYGLDVSGQELADRARKWELRHPGRTPRVAKQFIAYQLDTQSGS